MILKLGHYYTETMSKTSKKLTVKPKDPNWLYNRIKEHIKKKKEKGEKVRAKYNSHEW